LSYKAKTVTLVTVFEEMPVAVASPLAGDVFGGDKPRCYG